MMLADLGEFFRVLSEVVDGFAERATVVARLLANPTTTFLIVTSPEPIPVEEAIFFRRRLAEAGMQFGALVVNRQRVLARLRPAIDERALAADLGGDSDLASRSVQALEDLRALARRDAASLQRLTAELDERHPIVIPQMDHDISDLAGLLRIERYLFATPRQRSALLAEQAF